MSMAPRPGARAGRRSWPAAVGVSAPPSDSDKISAERPDLVVFNGYANQYPRLSKAQGGIVELSLPEAGHHPFVNRTVPGDDSEIPRQRR